MELLVVLLICGFILMALMSGYPAVNEFVQKHVLKLLDALGTVLLWGFWVLIGYVLLSWVGIVERLAGCKSEA